MVNIERVRLIDMDIYHRLNRAARIFGRTNTDVTAVNSEVNCDGQENMALSELFLSGSLHMSA